MEDTYLCLGCMGNKGIADICPHCGFDSSKYQHGPMQLPLGTVLNDRYIIGIVLGHGGFGITYLAWDKKFQTAMAIKEFLPSTIASRSENNKTVTAYSNEDGKRYNYYLDKFLEEARTLAQFNNESGIVSVQDFFKENGTVYLVMFYVNGETLERYVIQQGGKISYNQAIKIMRVVLESLAKVHKAGVIHRDISPDNIFITSDLQVKLLDFGAARYVIGDESKSLSVILKRGYAPSEQYYSKGKQGPWTDVYSSAATLYRLITGEKPQESMERVMNDELKPPSEPGINLPKQAEAALMKALSVRAEDRYQDIQSFLDALDGGVAEKTVLLIENDKTELQESEPELAKVTTYATKSDEVSAQPKKFCTECGFQLKDGISFCHNCGAEVKPELKKQKNVQTMSKRKENKEKKTDLNELEGKATEKTVLLIDKDETELLKPESELGKQSNVIEHHKQTNVVEHKKQIEWKAVAMGVAALIIAVVGFTIILRGQDTKTNGFIILFNILMVLTMSYVQYKDRNTERPIRGDSVWTMQ